MIQTKQAKRLTILIDASLKSVILDKLLELGAKGYNFCQCQGKGVHAITGDVYGGDNLLKIETVVTPETAAKILDFIHVAQFAELSNYALSAYADTVEVDVRDQSFAE